MVSHILAARPNFIKSKPVINELSNHGFENCIVHTNQHYDYEMSQIFFQELNIPKPDYNLGIKSGTHGEQTGKAIISLEKNFIKTRPKAVFVYGDVNSTLAGAIAASKLNIPIVHVESGCRSYDRSMPEEINRILVDNISSYLFCTEKSAMKNLMKEGFSKKNTKLVGNTAIDSLHNIMDKIKKTTLTQDYYLATFHRPFNVDNKFQLNRILTKLNNLKYKIIIPAHPRLKNNVTKNYKNIEFINPLGYLDFLTYIHNSKGVISDSGGVQCECSFLNIPLLTVRPTTEHLLTLKYGNKLINADGIDDSNFLRNNKNTPKVWDGKASKRIVKFLKGKI